MVMYLRTCQECLNKQKDVDPYALAENRKQAYMDRKCKRCGSMALDFGSPDVPRQQEDEDDSD